MTSLTKYGNWHLIPMDLFLKEYIIYSFGAGEDICYEFHLSGKINCEIHIFDPTPRAINHFKLCDNICKHYFEENNPTNKELLIKTYSNERFGGGDQKYLDYILSSKANLNNIFYHDIGLYNEDTTIDFYFPINKNQVSLSINNLQSTKDTIKLKVKKIDSLMKSLGHQKIDVLKLNIEGAEVASLIYMLSNTNIRPIYIIVKFRLVRDQNNSKNRELQHTLNKLLDKDYKIFKKRNDNFVYVIKDFEG